MTRDKNDWLLAIILDEIRKSKKGLDPTSVNKVAQGIVQNTANRYAELILKFLESNLEQIVDKRRTYARHFEERLLQRWKKPIDLLEVFIQMCTEVGEEFNNEYRSTVAKTHDYVFDVLTRLHARGCQISCEILSLLKAGLADGAYARWRTIHEIAAIAFFIEGQGQDVAKRYLKYEAVETYRESLAYQEHCRELGYEPPTEKELAVTKARYDDVLKTYGTDFCKPYGWIPENTLKKRNFAQIEKAAKLDKLRPYYMMACHNVHSGPKGIKFRLGLLKGGPQESMLLAGPSNTGLADPGQAATISLYQITTCLLSTRMTLERLSILKAMQRLLEQINPAFVEVQLQLEKEDDSLNGHYS